MPAGTRSDWRCAQRAATSPAERSAFLPACPAGLAVAASESTVSVPAHRACSAVPYNRQTARTPESTANFSGHFRDRSLPHIAAAAGTRSVHPIRRGCPAGKTGSASRIPDSLHMPPRTCLSDVLQKLPATHRLWKTGSGTHRRYRDTPVLRFRCLSSSVPLIMHSA